MMLGDDCISSGSILKDYDSKELMHFLSIISSNEDGEKGNGVLLGDNAPYAVPKGTSVKLINDIALKNTVNTDDALLALEFGVAENPPLLSYLQSLQQLSSESLPSQVAKTVFQVFQKRSDGLDLEVLSCDDIDFLKKRIEEKEMWILPIVQDLWVSLHHSLHHSFGLICWCDDEKLKKGIQELEIC
ncbi:hypothetical protein Tco_1091487 [Tanacetum coccineum]|uniref:Uncharacterized protein n=1 Tax=Tanacetum coccineum TaxID=301880 RepID=A0ABQ5I8D5_9ASTR